MWVRPDQGEVSGRTRREGEGGSSCTARFPKFMEARLLNLSLDPTPRNEKGVFVKVNDRIYFI